jgi:hypothetical protein
MRERYIATITLQLFSLRLVRKNISKYRYPDNQDIQEMPELSLEGLFGIGVAIGIIATLFVILYFSRKQMQSLSVDLETKILNDLDDKFVAITRVGMDHPELIKVVSKSELKYTPELAFSYHILYTLAHGLHMRQRGVVGDNEWAGWIRWTKSAFQHGEIYDIWKNNIELEKWFDPAFQDFINQEIIPNIQKEGL